MKKIFSAVIIICICVFSLTSCTGEKSPEKLLSESQELNWETIAKTSSENKAKAIKEYEGKLFNYTASVMSIEEHYCVVSELKSSDSPSVKIYLENEDLYQLKKGDLIKVVGKLRDIEIYEISSAVIIETVKAEDNIKYLIETFIDDFESAKVLLNSKDKFTKLTEKELNETIPSGWIEQEYYFKSSSGEYEQVAHYTGIIKLESNGTGRVRTPGSETIDWFVEGDNLYLKTNTNSDKLTKEDKYKYDVCRLDEKTLICFGQNTVFLLISNALVY